MSVDLTALEDALDDCDCTPDMWVGRIEAGDLLSKTEPSASAWVCDRIYHQQDATRYVEAVAGLPAQFVPR